MEQIKTFISYAHVDQEYFKDFTGKFKMAVQGRRQIEWSLWDDTNIHLGSFWDDEIQKNIQNCNVALLLVSMGFMSSKYIREQEFSAFKKRYADNGVLVIPILFAPCHFEEWEDLSQIQFFKPTGSDYGKPDKKNDFTYADLVRFKNDGTIIPNPDADRYVIDLATKIEAGYNQFQTEQKGREEKAKEAEKRVVDDILSSETVNNLSEAPKPRSYFTGRVKELELFKKAIDNNENLILIDGTGGVGKTQFVSRCIELFVPRENVVWYDCTSASHLDTLISEAGYPELLKGSSKTDREKFSAFKEKIQKHELFVFLDNFQDTNENPVFREFLVFIQNHLKNGYVVVIDRDDIRSASFEPFPIHIEGFKEDQLTYAKAVIAYSYADSIRISDEDLSKICSKLQGHPFAISLALQLLKSGETAEGIIEKIAQNDDTKKVSERLLNAIFERPDALKEEQDFIAQFSIFTGKVSDAEVQAVIDPMLVNKVRGKLRQKNLLTYKDGFYEIHPLARELCYQKLTVDKQTTNALHLNAAKYYLNRRTDKLNPADEEQLFHHLIQSESWKMIEQQLFKHGRKFIIQGLLALLSQLLDNLTQKGIDHPVFAIYRGDIANIQGKWSEAEAHYDVARKSQVNDEITAEGIRKYGNVLYLKGYTRDALVYFEQAFKIASQHNLQEEMAVSCGEIGSTHKRLGDWKLADETLRSALTIAKNIHDKESAASILLSIADLYKNKMDFESAIKHCKEALGLFNDIHDKQGIAHAIHHIGVLQREKKQYADATNHFNLSKTIFEEIGDINGISQVLNSMARLNGELGNHEDEQKNYYESKQIAEEIGNKLQLATTLNNIGLKLKHEKKFRDAVEQFNKSLLIFHEINSIHNYAITSGNLGRLYFEQKEYYLAVLSLFKSICLFSKINDKHYLNECLIAAFEIREEIGLATFKKFTENAFKEIDPALHSFLTGPTQILLKQPIRNIETKVGRNNPCPCGSGKKYKNCHGKGL